MWHIEHVISIRQGIVSYGHIVQLDVGASFTQHCICQCNVISVCSTTVHLGEMDKIDTHHEHVTVWESENVYAPSMCVKVDTPPETCKVCGGQGSC